MALNLEPKKIALEQIEKKQILSGGLSTEYEPNIFKIYKTASDVDRKEGTIIIKSSGAGIRVDIDSKTLIIIKEDDILGTWESK